MKIDISSAIADLLFKNQTVVLPGFGAFVGSYKSATIDYVQGEIAPPSKELNFNENLLVNDGVLVNYLQEKYKISAEEAEQAIKQFVKEVMATLEKREMVVFPKIGKLYRDYENKYKFIADNTNFNTDSFGLPDVNFFPVLRDKGATATTTKVGAASAGAATTSTSKSSYSSKSNNDSALPAWMRVGLPILAILSVIVLLFSIYMLTRDDSKISANEMAINEERLNKKPGDEATLDDPEDIEDMKMDEEEDDGGENTEGTEIDSEEPTIAPNQKEALIIIHSFGNKNNVEKFMKTLLSDGFQPKSVKDGKLTRVGIVKLYEEESELTELIKELEKLYETTPKLWEE